MATAPLISDDAASAEMLAVIGIAMRTNGLVTAKQVPVDEVFEA
ncbi:hypothetical protein [uncultured Tateyamaria sp.]|nr:hypothetical protein [uncultured Tateyamaria sp.]